MDLLLGAQGEEKECAGGSEFMQSGFCSQETKEIKTEVTAHRQLTSDLTNT